MTHDPWALPAALYSIIVKRDAVTRSYPGGVEEFERVHQPYRKNGALFLLVHMSRHDIEYVLSELSGTGIVLGQDIAVGGLTEGAIVECPGVRFWNEDRDTFPGRWFINVDDSASTGALAPTVEAQVASEPIAPATASGPRTGLPRRVVGNLIHYIYNDDCEDEECFNDTQPAVACEPPTQPTKPTHTITLGYGYDCHSIEVDSETLAAIISGECVRLEGQGFFYEEEGLRDDHRYIDLANGCAGFTLDNCREFEALWIALGENGALIDFTKER